MSRRQARPASEIVTGPRAEVEPLCVQLDAERLGQLARARAEILEPLAPAAALAISSIPSQGSSARISTPAPIPSGSDDRVQHRVHAVGAIDVGAAGRPEQRQRARRAPDEGVARRLGLVVGLGLDDHSCRLAVAHDAADQRRARPPHLARVEARAHPARERAARRRRAARAGARAPCRRPRPSTRARSSAAAARPGLRGRASARSPPARRRRSSTATCRSSTATRTRSATTPCASRNGRPPRTSRSAISTAAISSSEAALASRSRSKLIVRQHAARRGQRSASSVSAVSNRCSLSSCMSLL